MRAPGVQHLGDRNLSEPDYDDLPPGTYRARLRYAVKRDIEDLDVHGDHLPPGRATIRRARTLWQGAAVSDWITFTVE
jgi:hypothetical protein